MPVTIWEPARYMRSFSTGTLSEPVNGEFALAPYNKDTKVCEISRFTGWKQVYFCDTGEFELVTQQIAPEQAKIGRMVDIDGDMFVIEDVEWSLGSDGYTCTLSGRDFWAYLERQVSRRWVGEAYFMGADGAAPYSGEALMRDVAMFFMYYDKQAGWFRDFARFPQSSTSGEFRLDIVVFDLQNETEAQFLARSTQDIQYVNELMNYAAEWRTFCNWLDIGIRFDFEWQENDPLNPEHSGMYAIKPTIYDGSDSGVVINTRSRGVSDFTYEESSRTAVNAILATWENKRYSFYAIEDLYKNGDWSGSAVDTGVDDAVMSIATAYKSNGEQSYPERAITWSEKYLSLGQPPSANEGASDMISWAKGLVDAEYKGNSKSFKFKYDNAGAYKYGQHFKLGDKLTVQDDYLGVSASQRLTGVKTTYSENKLEYDFEFSNQRISQNDTIKRKFAEIDRRTSGTYRR